MNIRSIELILTYNKFLLLLCVFLVLGSHNLYSQVTDSTNVQILRNNKADSVRIDSTKMVEDVPLDIAQDRGLFIVTPDNKMQLRILGSVRYLVVFDGYNLQDKNAFSTFEIPTGELNKRLPNYFNGLDQTRLGFEVTRRTDSGDIFIRLETDFAGENGFRIRHAYGQYGKFLFGQTWSLFSHLNAAPTIVDFAGPTASLVTRNPQLRYMKPNFIKGINMALGLEYVIPNLGLPDTLSGQSVQLLPDVTARFDKNFDWGSAQVSGLLPVLSGRDLNDNLIIKLGWGVSASVVVNSWKKGKWFFQGVIGRAITRYFNDLSGNGLDLIFNTEGKFRLPLVVGYYGTYEHRWTEKLLSNATYGYVHIQSYDFSLPDSYKKGHTLRVNTFYDIVEGARMGIEYIYGKRKNIDGISGGANRVNLLFYYDF